MTTSIRSEANGNYIKNKIKVENLAVNKKSRNLSSLFFKCLHLCFVVYPADRQDISRTDAYCYLPFVA